MATPAVDVDRALMAALARDGRASYTDLAEKVGLSVSAVHQRVRRLEQRGLITGYRAGLDAKALGLPLTAFVSITPSDVALHTASTCAASPAWLAFTRYGGNSRIPSAPALSARLAKSIAIAVP